MPLKSKTGKGRVGMKRAKRMITKQRKSKAKKNMDTFFLKAKTEFSVVPSQGVVVANYIYQFFGLVQNWSGGVTSNKEWMLYAGLYDKVRINSMKVTITPKANVFDQANAQNDATLTLTGDGMLHSVIDRDSAAPPSVAALNKYPSYRKTSIMKKHIRTYSVKYPTGNWLDCQNFYSDAGNVALIQQLGLDGGVTIYAENLVEDKFEIFNEPWAHIMIEYNCVFQGKTSAAITVNEDGTFLLTPYTLPSGVAFSQSVGFQGTLADEKVILDASGNIIGVTQTSDEQQP